MLKDEKGSAIDERYLASRAQELVGRMVASRSLIEQEWAKEFDLYNSEYSSDEKEYSEFLGIKRLFVPKTYIAIQRLLIEILDAILFDTNEIVSVQAQRNVPIEKVEAVKALLNYRLNGHPVDFYKVLYEACLDALRNKVGIFKIWPRLKVSEEDRVVRDYDENGMLVEKRYKDQKIDAYEPVIEAVPPEDIYVDPMATWINYHQFPIVHRYVTSIDKLRGKDYKNLDLLEEASISSNEVKMKRMENLIQSPFSESIRGQKKIYVYEVWDQLPIGKNGELTSCWYVCAGGSERPSVVIRDVQPNDLPYKFSEFEYTRPPFVIGLAYPESHALYGKSFPEITVDLQKEINIVRNQEREAVARALRPIVYVNRDAEVDLMALVNRRIGGFVQGNGSAADAITELPTQNPLAYTQGHGARVEADYFEAGVPPNLLGISPASQTATGSTQQLINANKKISQIIKNLSFTLILPSFRYLLRLDQFYCTDEFINNVTGMMLGWKLPVDEYPPRKIIEGDFDFVVNFGMSRDAQVTKWMMLIDRANQANQMTMSLVSTGVVDPSTVKFYNTIWMFKQLFKVMGLKAEEEFLINAFPPMNPQVEPLGVSPQAKIEEPRGGIQAKGYIEGIGNVQLEGTSGTNITG